MTVEPSVSGLLAAAAAALGTAGIDQPAREARWLAAHAAGTDQSGLLRGTPIDSAAFARLLARRVAREPLAYILGHAPFRDLTLAVSPATLIPRMDSETLIEAALAARPDRASVARVLDLGSGLLLAALSDYPAAWGLGIDRVPEACRLAQDNAARNRLGDRSAWVCADWTAPIAGTFDLILSNPPYIPTAEIAALMPEVARHEPAAALDGGADGLDAYRLLVSAIAPLLAPNGLAIFEVGAGQADHVISLAARSGWTTSVRPDLGGRARAVTVQRRGA
jgi:release factor glutamine methyltransferase